MVCIGIRELRQHASRYVRMAREGRRIAVTDRGISSPTWSGGRIGERACPLEAADAYRPAVGSLLDLLPPPPTPEGDRPLSEVVEELRDQERW
jgi:antitoxin (DNA-binding transcriptional repressor) of toxin-antitoxin stability system